MLADIALALDPCLLAERAGWVPDPWQRDVLRGDAQRLILNCCRQSGKSSAAAIVALHQALFSPGSLVLLLSPTERQSKELYRKVLDAYAATGRPLTPDSETRLWLELPNASRVIALPGAEANIRGFSAPALIVIDEAAHCSPELFAAVLPMLTVGRGRMLLLSTPNGRQGFFYTVWTEGGPGWHRVELPATACPRITPEALEEARRLTPPREFEREYLVQFNDTEAQVFGSEYLAAAQVVGLPDLLPAGVWA